MVKRRASEKGLQREHRTQARPRAPVVLKQLIQNFEIFGLAKDDDKHRVYMHKFIFD